MQTATYRPSPVPTQLPQSQQTTDPVRASVAHLLARAHGIPCTAAAQAFAQLVQPPARFGIALDILLPILSGRTEVGIIPFMVFNKNIVIIILCYFSLLKSSYVMIGRGN